ncbi:MULTISPECIES: SLATT domain-containing protein [Streptomyces violaceusniger group]
MGCRRRSREHELSYSRWSTLSLTFGISIAVFSGAAGTTLLASAKPGSPLSIVAGILGALAVVLTAVDAKFSSTAKAEAHRRAFAGFSSLRTDYDDLATMGARSTEEARGKLEHLNTRKSQLEKDSPPTEQYARKKRRKDEASLDERDFSVLEPSAQLPSR